MEHTTAKAIKIQLLLDADVPLADDYFAASTSLLRSYDGMTSSGCYYSWDWENKPGFVTQQIHF